VVKLLKACLNVAQAQVHPTPGTGNILTSSSKHVQCRVKITQFQYYKTSTVLDAKPKTSMSYTWRNVLRGIELMKEGIVWRVGDGRGLKI